GWRCLFIEANHYRKERDPEPGGESPPEPTESSKEDCDEAREQHQAHVKEDFEITLATSGEKFGIQGEDHESVCCRDRG
ncbi:MAG: hypothetical protein WBN03_01655, partial [Desulfobacterales bacterium]